jgi:hypothetical protein
MINNVLLVEIWIPLDNKLAKKNNGEVKKVLSTSKEKFEKCGAINEVRR